MVLAIERMVNALYLKIIYWIPMFIRLFIWGTFLLNTAFATSQHLIQVGETRVTIKQIHHGDGKYFIHLHQNETTALKAAQHLVETEGGNILTLVHPGQRNVVFHLQHVRYEFDPNRMFTDAGIKKSLSTFGHYSPEAHAQAKHLAEQVKSLLPSGKIIAVHNNNDYSIKAYFPGNSVHHDAKALSLNHQQYYRNFYLVTKPKDFSRFKSLRYNAILQSSAAVDDGSLSVYLAHRDYVNVEAGYGQLLAQIDMLKLA